MALVSPEVILEGQKGIAMPKKPTSLTGCAGEHFVAYRLSRMGYLVALTRGGSPSVDLMVGTVTGQKAATIQVKTANDAFHKCRKPDDSYWYWRVGSKALELRGECVFYAFVDFKCDADDPSKSISGAPDVFVVPADIVAGNLEGHPKNHPVDFWFIISEKDKSKWHEAWHLIERAFELRYS